jgi:DtxR family transcriptional regulator, Mn-dependent transcriptional regulator
VSICFAASAQNMNASSGSGLCPSRIRTSARLQARPRRTDSSVPRSLPQRVERPRRAGRRGLIRHRKRRLHLLTVPGPALTDSIQDYLKAIYKLQEGEARVSVTALAREQGVAAGSASEMVKKLAALELVDHAPYKGVRLTAAGERVAVEVIRHHRLLELYLAETLGLAVDDVHDEADRLEHVLSEELEARIDRALGFPTHDPHGDPIPNAALQWPKSRTG